MDFNAIKTIAKTALISVKKHSPEIFAGLGLVTGGLAVISAARNRDTHVKLRNEKLEAKEGEKLTLTEELECGAKAYWKTGLIFLGSAACQWASNKSYIEKYAALLAAYKISEKELSGTETAILKTFGQTGVDKIEDTKAKDIALRDSVSFDESKVIYTGLGNELFKDPKTGRFFRCSYEAVKGAFLEIEAELKDESKCLNDLYYKINLEPCDVGESYGLVWPMGGATNWKIVPVRDETRFNGEVLNVLKYSIHISDYIDAYDEL